MPAKAKSPVMPDKLERWPIERLVPYEKNARTHSPEQVAQIAASIQEFGFTNPILVASDDGILAGHGRLAAAKDLGLAEVPVVVLDHLTPTQRRAYVLADNKLALNAGWDDSILSAELEGLQLEEFDLSLLGWSDDELAGLLPQVEELPPEYADADAVPEPPAEPVTKPGDVWLLGKHRVMCGDSTAITDVERLMDGKKAQLCFTSPPYGQQRDYTAEGKEKVQDWDALMQGVFSVLPVSDAAQVLVNLGLIHRDGEWIPYWDGWIKYMSQLGWRRFGWYVWDQGPGMPGDWNGRLAPAHEFIWHFNKQSIRAEKARECKHAGQAHGGKGQRGKDGVVKERSSGSAPVQSHAIHDSVFRVNRQGAMHGADGHPAPYPVGLPLIALQSWGGDVYEPFCGSGTTLVAAEQLGRRCYGMEISPAYCDVIINRWQQFTGKTATLESTGEPFPAAE
jgi:DNA modification methylase